DPFTGLWRHHDGPVEPALRLTDLRYDEHGTLTYPHTRVTAPEAALQHYVDDARTLLTQRAASCAGATDAPSGASPDFEALRWFELPRACLG
ncbi:MAG: aminotransferase class V-fold PLP-dependent enzyme, partial [Pseudonocardia sp.]